ncbi:MAG: helix-turn-helix domain-containing protein [Vicinamibacteraceae bacterium]
MTLLLIIIAMDRATTLIRRLGRVIRAARGELGLTQAQMAARCGLSPKHFGQLERGDVEASLSALDSLARGLRMSLPEMLHETGLPRRGDRPTLVLRDWQRIRSVSQMLAAHADRVISYAQATGGDTGTTSSAFPRRARHDRHTADIGNR